MTYVTVARVGELPPGASLRVEVSGITIALHNAGGTIWATQDTCCGRGGRLSRGRVNPERRTVSCPLHDWEFDLETGQYVLAPFHRLKTYPVLVVGNEVQVDTG